MIGSGVTSPSSIIADEARQVVAHPAVAVLGAEDRAALDSDRDLRDGDGRIGALDARQHDGAGAARHRIACVCALASVAASST